MIERKQNKCKGTGQAKGYGCGEKLYLFKYGLCKSCYKEFLFSNDGIHLLKKAQIIGHKKVVKEKKSEDRQKNIEFNSKKYMSLADMYFSRYIRLKHSEDGYCTCYTCGTIKPIKEVDNGHYIKRAHKATRYNENNCRPQCKKCNGDTLHNGKQVEFRINLINEIGIEEVEYIENISKTSLNKNSLYYKELSDSYRQKVNELQKELGIKYW